MNPVTGDNGQALAEALYPRVSTILTDMGLRKELPDLPNIAWGRARGTAVHKAIELYELGQLDPATLHPDVRGPFQGYLAFKRDEGYQPEAIEEEVVHRHWRVRGRLDSRGPFRDKKMAILDFKCGEPDKQAAAYQLALYAQAWWAQHDEVDPDSPMPSYLVDLCPCYVVQLGDESYRVHDVTSHEAAWVTCAAVRLWHAQREKLLLPVTGNA